MPLARGSCISAISLRSRDKKKWNHESHELTRIKTGRARAFLEETGRESSQPGEGGLNGFVRIRVIRGCILLSSLERASPSDPELAEEPLQLAAERGLVLDVRDVADLGEHDHP